MRILLLIIIGWLLAISAGAETKLSLEEAINQSLEHSYSVKSSEQKLNSADLDYKSSRADRFPVLSTDLTAFYLSQVPKAYLTPVNSIELGSKENYQIDVKLAMPFFTGGKIKGQIKINDQLKNIKEHESNLAKMSSAYNCRQAYFGLMAARSIESSVAASKKRIELIRADVKNMYDNGLADSLDILEAELAYQQVLKVYEEQKSAVNKASAVLANDLGLDVNEIIIPTEEILPPDYTRVDTMVNKADIDRPEMLMSRASVLAAQTMIGLKKSDYYPTVGGYIGYSGGKPNRDFISDKYNDNLIFGAALTWSLNIGQKTHYNVESARHQKYSAELEYKKVSDLLLLQAQISLENLKLAHESWRISSREYEIAQDKYRLAELQYKEGRLAINRLLEMEAELTGSEEMNRAALINYYIKHTDYLYSLGSENIYGGL